MATLADSIRRSNINLGNISSSLNSTSKSLSKTNSSIDRFSKNLSANTKTKRELFGRSTILRSRREEASRRQELEDELKSSKVSSSPSRGFSFASKSEQGPLGRLVGFLSFLTSGWIMENLPTWIFVGQEFLSRIYKFGSTIPNMMSRILNISTIFGETIQNSLDSILRLDFDEFTEGSVAKSFDELKSSIEGLGTSITDTFKLFTTPLTQSLDTGEQAPKIGEPREGEMFIEPGTPSRVIGIHKQALDIISGPESGGSYNAMNQGQAGDRPGGSKKWLGKNLTDMTIGEVLQRQAYEEDTSHPRLNDYGIWAAGRYQIIPGTMRTAVKNAGLKTTDMFSPTNQDRLGIAVLKSQGIRAWTSGGSRYTARERAIIEKAQTEPVSYASVPQTPSSSSIKSGKVIEYLTGDRTHKRYRADHAAGNYHDHIAFDSKQTRDSAIKWLIGKGWMIGSINTGRHANGSFHYSNQAFDIPFYPNQSKKGVTDDAKGETLLSSKLRTDLISGGFNGPQLQGPSTPPPPAQISPPPKVQQPFAEITPERKGAQYVFIDDTKPSQPPVMYSQESSYAPPVNESRVLNTYIKNKLLLDLAYL